MAINNIEVTDKLVSVTRYILDTMSEEGNWKSPEHEPWGPIITVLNVDHLLSCGMKIDDEWSVNCNGQIHKCTLNKCLEYLNSQINQDGNFGADFWDSCKMAAFVLKYKIQEKIPKFTCLQEYIKNKYNIGYLSSHDYNWAGPGAYAACADFFLYNGQSDIAKAIINSVITLQKRDGSFVGMEKSTGGYFVNPIWHTSQVIMTILNSHYDINEDIVNNAKQYMIDKQAPNGGYDDFSNYGIYYASYAILGFLAFNNRPENLKRALDNVINLISIEGKVGDAGGTTMVALALGKYLGDDVHNIFEKIQIKRSKALLEENKILKQKNDELISQINVFNTRYGDADIVLTKKEVWKWGILLAIIIFIIPILTDFVKSTLFKNNEHAMTQQITDQSSDSFSEDSKTENDSILQGRNND